ncbi:uncharacterized protein LOC104581676 isoform X2 [Brachypodium distachyon]|uniref:uncharacterized protein LOC104581676 isoform X2 n=1 Tax=Brachypodium distachyon TaxID=15368 RepID=UPI00071CC140|nr:uncharacterized protein LOC104581676 isoform X2 [Brachypodium distachyon]|eukprot:XP_014758317.1 uncharacterized protein LOC104581676 isoform X2 [Brachypodium distachyon]
MEQLTRRRPWLFLLLLFLIAFLPANAILAGARQGADVHAKGQDDDAGADEAQYPDCVPHRSGTPATPVSAADHRHGPHCAAGTWVLLLLGACTVSCLLRL